MEQYNREKSQTVARERSVLVAALLPGDGLDPHDPLGELASLADTAGALVVDRLLQKRLKPDPATFIGEGKVKELAEMCRLHGAQAVIFENDLSPAQIRNLEEALQVKVVDRVELILDIFAMRARTLEAKLQVELAQLIYTYPRLTNMWSHLERHGGGIGTRGPGEQQLETDRRIVQRKKLVLKAEIRELQERKTREVAARNLDHYTVGIVGYTNAGKSTLFNTLTGAGTYADDKLFATLSTLTRQWKLGGGENVMLSDTVGFVRNLPHLLVASFKATLEEAVHADLLLVVLDVSDRDAAKHHATVQEVLKEIGADQVPHLLVLNKVDAVGDNAELLVLESRFPDAIAVSARTGRGLDALIRRVTAAAKGEEMVLRMTIPHADGKTLQFLETRAEILERDYGAEALVAQVRIGARQLAMLLANGTQADWPGKAPKAKSAWGR